MESASLITKQNTQTTKPKLTSVHIFILVLFMLKLLGKESMKATKLIPHLPHPFPLCITMPLGITKLLPNLEVVYYCHVHKLPPLLMNLNKFQLQSIRCTHLQINTKFNNLQIYNIYYL